MEKQSSIDEWTLDGVLDELANIDKSMKDRQFAFILGSGASFTSGIPTGKTLAENWLREIHRRECTDGSDIETWVQSPAMGVPGLTFLLAAEHYPKIFERRFRHDREQGYAALERAMEGKSPSLGYSLLAEIIQHTRHKVVVTTNFDNLVADALAMHAHQSPLVVAHESLAGFVRPQLRRPLVAKIHRDLFLSPQNDEQGVSMLDKDWAAALRKLFLYFTPVVVGYGGNDGSLMGLLESLGSNEIVGRTIWCYRDEPPNATVVRVLTKHHGIQVKIPGFDDFMLRLAAKLVENFDVAAIAERTETLGKERSVRYRQQAEELQKASVQGGIEKQKTGQVLSHSAEGGKSWWAWELKARAEVDLLRRDAIYREGLEQFPRSVELLDNYASFLANKRRDLDGAEAVYKKALEFDPASSTTIGNYAIFLASRRKDYDAAEAMFKRQLDLDPTSARATANYAVFLANNRKDLDAAEVMYKKALELDASYAHAAGSYAKFLANLRKDLDAAEVMFQKTLELDPTNANAVCNYAVFLANFRKDYDAAEKMHKRALELDPADASIAGSYAIFLTNLRQDFDTAQLMYQKALDLDPANGHTVGSYAIFLANVRKDFDAAEVLYKKALDLLPNDANNAANFASMLLCRWGAGAPEQIFDLVKRVLVIESGMISQALAEVLLYGCLSSELTSCHGGIYLRWSKFVLQRGFVRGLWDFSPVFEAVLSKIDVARQDFYRAMGAAILDADKLDALGGFHIWRDAEALDPFAAD